MRVYFEELLGNNDTKERLGTAIEKEIFPHALLIGGPAGSGKSTYALEIAAAMNCENKKSPAHPLPCHRCNNCRRIFDKSFPDVKVLSKPSDKASLGVEAVKDFREDMFLSATEADYKIYIIDDAETMTAEAQNALLKILEEPPSRVIIILLARECDRILTTIKSRVQYVPISRFSDDELKEHILNKVPDTRRLVSAEPERFAEIIISADGRLGRAIELLDSKRMSDSTEAREDIIQIIRALEGRAPYSNIYKAISLLPTKRAEFSAALELLILALRDLIIVKYCKNSKLLFFTSRESAMLYSKELSIKKLLSIYDAVNETNELCAKNANVNNLAATLASKLKNQSNR